MLTMKQDLEVRHQHLKFLPFGAHDDSVRLLAGLVGAGAHAHLLTHCAQAPAAARAQRRAPAKMSRGARLGWRRVDKRRRQRGLEQTALCRCALQVGEDLAGRHLRQRDERRSRDACAMSHCKILYIITMDALSASGERHHYSLALANRNAEKQLNNWSVGQTTLD